MTVRPGYWDIEGCAWVGGEPTHVVPPVPASAPSVGAAADTDVDVIVDTSVG